MEGKETSGVASSREFVKRTRELEWFFPRGEKKLFFGDGRDSALAER